MPHPNDELFIFTLLGGAPLPVCWQNVPLMVITNTAAEDAVANMHRDCCISRNCD